MRFGNLKRNARAKGSSHVPAATARFTSLLDRVEEFVEAKGSGDQSDIAKGLNLEMREVYGLFESLAVAGVIVTKGTSWTFKARRKKKS